MENQNPTITIITDDKVEKAMLTAYWQPDGHKFKFTYDEVLGQFEIERNDLWALIKAKSLFELFCDDCGKPIAAVNLRSDIKIHQHFYQNICRCTECVTNAKELAVLHLTPEQIVTQKLETGIERKAWQGLSKYQK